MFFLFLENYPFKPGQKLQKALKRTLGCKKIQIVFKNQRNLSNVFRFKDGLPYDVLSCGVQKFRSWKCNASYYDETDRNMKVSSGKHIEISALTVKKAKPSVESRYMTTFCFLIMTPHLIIPPFCLRRLISFY